MIRCWLGVTRYTTAFLLYPPIFANFDFDIYFKQRPQLSEQSLPHQWRSIDQTRYLAMVEKIYLVNHSHMEKKTFGW